MTHVYTSTFFDYIDEGAHTSARAVIDALNPDLKPQSVLDLGCGRGVWLQEWQDAGVAKVCGVDGSYVDVNNLAIKPEDFVPADLTRPFVSENRFDLAQSLEVGEHLPKEAAQTLVQSLVSASDRVLFSAAVVGQGGEFHINEQPLSFWQSLFADHGYTAFECLRPKLADNRKVEPWYRYNGILYVNEAGRANLPQHILETEVSQGTEVKNGGGIAWRTRQAVVRHLPRPVVTNIAQIRSLYLAQNAKRRTQQRA